MKTLEPRAFRQACREFALSQVEAQREDFKRLGVMGDWDRPYMTMQPATKRSSCARSRRSCATVMSTRV